MLEKRPNEKLIELVILQLIDDVADENYDDIWELIYSIPDKLLIPYLSEEAILELHGFQNTNTDLN